MGTLKNNDGKYVFFERWTRKTIHMNNVVWIKWIVKDRQQFAESFNICHLSSTDHYTNPLSHPNNITN